MGELLIMPAPHELTPEQTTHWERQLESAERQVECALRMLGRLPIEEGIEG